MDIDIDSELNKYKNIIDIIETHNYVRVNWIKTRARLAYEQTFLPYIYKLPNNIRIGTSLDYLAGYVHSQSLASAIPVHILEPNSQDIVYDATAAPGSKTTQMAMLMNNRGIIIANDKKERIKALKSNIQRLGVINTTIISRDAKTIPNFNYSKALVDAPCSSLGSHRHAWTRIKASIVKTLSEVQYKILEATYMALKPGGIMVYSTCTPIYYENENVVSKLLNKYDAKLMKIDLPVKVEPGIDKDYQDLELSIRVTPDIAGEYFYIAKIFKPFSSSDYIA